MTPLSLIPAIAIATGLMILAGIALDVFLRRYRLRRVRRREMAEYYVRNMPLRRD